MKSKSSTFLILAVIVLVILGAVYFFVVRKPSADPVQPGLVSTSTGTATGLQTNQAADSTGSQVVEILRNVSAIKLDDSVFRNPSFALLVDTSIVLPAPTSQGRRNPFAPGAADAGTVPVIIQTETATTAGTAL